MLVSSVPLSENARLRPAANGDHGIEFAHHAGARQRRVGDQRSFGREGSDNGARMPNARFRPPRFLTAKPSSR